MWKNWVNFIVGLWVILSGYLAFGPEMNATNLTIAGIIISALSLWHIVEMRSHENRYHERRPMHA